MPYDPKAVANFILELARRDGVKVSPLKLQKIMYFAHGWHLARIGEALLDEPVEAWEYGPVIRSIYVEFLDFGNNPISRMAREIDDSDWDDIKVTTPKLPEKEETKRTRLLTENTFRVFGKYPAFELSEMTHEEGTPWWRVVEEQGGSFLRKVPIPNEWIKDYFVRQAEERG